jgi:hypothetical protein
MYKLEIELGWEEVVTIESRDFNKIAILQEFIAEQEECDWSEDEDMIFTDEDGVSYVYDEELDEWVEVEEDGQE